jgi:hypothetical protein
VNEIKNKIEITKNKILRNRMTMINNLKVLRLRVEHRSANKISSPHFGGAMCEEGMEQGSRFGIDAGLPFSSQPLGEGAPSTA